MSNSGKCTDVIGSVRDTVVLGIKVAGDVGKDLDTYLINALQSEEVQKEIRKSLEEIARAGVRNAPLAFSPDEAKKMAVALLNNTATAVGRDALNQVKKSSQYLRLRQSAEGIASALRCSPMGVWFEQNKKIIYIVASGLILGGAVGMYVARTGDQAVEPITKMLKDKKFTTRPAGTLEISAGGFRFIPSKREFQMEIDATMEFERIKVEFTVSGHATDASASIASAGGRVIIPFGKAVARVESSYDPRNMRLTPVNLGLGIEFTEGGVRMNLAGRIQLSNSRPTSGSIGLGLRGNIKGIPVNVDLGGKLDTQSGGAILSTIRAEW